MKKIILGIFAISGIIIIFSSLHSQPTPAALNLNTTQPATAILSQLQTYNFTTNLKPGLKNNGDVKELQTILISQKLLTGTADGSFGPMTTTAVKKFQMANGLTADGSVGPLTRKVLSLIQISSSPTTTPTTSSTSVTAPTVTLAAPVYENSSVTLKFTATSASSCDLLRDTREYYNVYTGSSAGTVTKVLDVNTSPSADYTISCVGPGGTTVSNISSVVYTAPVADSTVTSQGNIPGQQNITPPVTLPPSTGADEPVYNASSDILVMQDNMNEYTDAMSMGAMPLGSTPRIAPLPAPDSDGSPVDPTLNQVISPGRNGTGKALRLSYSGVAQDAANYLTLNTADQPNLSTQYFQYWARVNVSGPIGGGALAVKWFEAWHKVSTGSRIQWATHDHLPWIGGGTIPTYWQVYDQAQTASQASQPVGPYFADINDNQWHRYTYSFRPNTTAGARDGLARMWIDGTKVIDVSAVAIGVTPPGGNKVWCNADDVDALANNDGIGYIRWGSTQTTNTPPWTYDIDDFTWWTR